MTDKQLEKLATRVAELVLTGLIEKQKEWDQQFTTDLNELTQDGFGNARLVNE